MTLGIGPPNLYGWPTAALCRRRVSGVGMLGRLKENPRKLLGMRRHRLTQARA